MKLKIAKLIDVKSIVTLLLTGVVCYLAVAKGFEIKEIYLIIIGFYFGTQAMKKNDENKDKENE